MTVPAASFQMVAAATGLLSGKEMSALVARFDQTMAAATLSGGRQASSIRRSQTAWLPREAGFEPLYERVWKAAQGFNEQFFGFDLTGVEQGLQIARYDADYNGTYDWHLDFSHVEQTRKLSLSIQLSEGADYEGGDLEFDFQSEITRAGRERGLVIAFPSFLRHRVAPVTRGTRYSLVAWVAGPRWR